MEFPETREHPTKSGLCGLYPDGERPGCLSVLFITPTGLFTRTMTLFLFVDTQ